MHPGMSVNSTAEVDGAKQEYRNSAELWARRCVRSDGKEAWKEQMVPYLLYLLVAPSAHVSLRYIPEASRRVKEILPR